VALSAVSRGAYTVGSIVGKAALPIAIDVIAIIATNKLGGKKIAPNMKWAISAIPGCTTLFLTSGAPKWDVSTLIAYCLYVSYKTLTFTERKEVATVPHPSLELLQTKYDQLMERLTFRFDNPDMRADMSEFAKMQHDEVRKRWKDPETLRLADELFHDAVFAMRELYADLEGAVAREPEDLKYKKMGELLTRQQRRYDYYSRFCKEGTVTLLDIYRSVRGLSFVVRQQPSGNYWIRAINYSLIENDNRECRMQESQDVGIFFTPESKQTTWRRVYNDEVDRFRPVLSTLDPANEKFRPYLEWTARDDQPPGTRQIDRFGPFKLRPCNKPA
jgi:hypothetical protein